MRTPHAVLLSPTTGYVLAEVRYSGVMNGAGNQNRVLSTTLFFAGARAMAGPTCRRHSRCGAAVKDGRRSG